VIYPAVKKVLPNKFVNGFLYALFVQAVMTFIVLPLTAFPKRPFVFTIDVVIGLLVLTIVFGLPISVMAENYYRKKAIVGSDK
jgi:hypothetical protein